MWIEVCYPPYRPEVVRFLAHPRFIRFLVRPQVHLQANRPLHPLREVPVRARAWDEM